MKNFEDIIFSREGRYAMGTIVALIIAALIFHMGYATGQRHAYGMRGGPDMQDRENRPPFLQPFGVSIPRGFIPGGHGLIGTVSDSDDSSVTLETRDGESRVVLVGTSTVIKIPPGATSTSLESGKEILVIGEPNESGNIRAVIIQILPRK